LTVRRLFLPPERIAAGRASLTPEAAHYLRDVLRLPPGSRLELFDGAGGAYAAEVEEGFADLRVEARREARPALALSLLVALARGEKMDWVVQKATELGVTDIRFTDTEHTVVHIEGSRTARRETHWRAVIISAAEQCGRLWLPTLHAPQWYTELLRERIAEQTLLLDPGAPPLDDRVPLVDTMLLIGPEGGFSDAERDAAIASGARAVGLGPLVLRTDTAPIAAIAVLRQAWGWQAP
jgi:16S rRNA (uracil1498-N3)-methyltransferase